MYELKVSTVDIDDELYVGSYICIEQPSRDSTDQIYLALDQVDLLIEWLKAAKKDLESKLN